MKREGRGRGTKFGLINWKISNMPFLNHSLWELLKVIIPINNIGKHAELKNNSFKSSNNKRLTLQTEERERQRDREREREERGERERN